MTTRLSPMFDFTRVSRGVACTLLGYFVAWPLLLVGVAISVFGFGNDTVPGFVGWLNWPVPVVFPLAAVVLVVDYFRRLNAGRMTATEVTGYRAAAVMMVVGSAFALSSGHWQPIAASAAAFLLTLLPQHGKALPSTWTPN